MRKINVYHFNTYLRGGAAIAAQRLFDSLLAYQDLNIRFYSKEHSDRKEYFHYNEKTKDSFFSKLINQVPFLEKTEHKILRTINKYMDGRPPGLEQFDPPFQSKKTKVPNPFPDIIHLHWISDFIDHASFFEQIPNDLPIVWTLHDINPFTGGCHYSSGCNKYKTICENCPQLGPNFKFDLAKYGFEVKENAFLGKNIHIAADSEWLKIQASQSTLFKNATSITCIHYGLDPMVFLPQDKEYCRKTLNIDILPDEFIICFGADWVNNIRKGMKELISAITILKNRNVNITCLVFGSGELESYKELKFIPFGHVPSLSFLSIVYNAADIFIIPSLEEAFGQTCLEAMACGIPVVGFNTGGIPDMIIDYETGLLANTGDAVDLAEKILLLLKDAKLRKNISENCRNKILSDFTLNIQASKYYELYNTILN